MSCHSSFMMSAENVDPMVSGGVDVVWGVRVVGSFLTEEHTWQD